MSNHCVFYRTKLKYDGRVTAIIRSLAKSFPNDEVILFEYPLDDAQYEDFPDNVKIIKPTLFFSKKRTSHLVQIVKAFIYSFKSFLFLLKQKPKTIQIHHQVVMYGPLVYKWLFRKCFVLYDDKEMYHPRDNNITKGMYFVEKNVIKSSDLVLIPNEFRRKALFFIHKNKVKDYLIVDNFIFDTLEKSLSLDSAQKLESLKKTGKKILLHQGVINKARKEDLLIQLIEDLPEDWLFCTIGITNEAFVSFQAKLPESGKSKTKFIGYIDYAELSSFYKQIDASIIFYNSSTFNNKYCAPNRLYSAVNNGVPVIINEDNHTLNVFINKYKNGITYEGKALLEEFFNDFDRYKSNAMKLSGKFQFNGVIPKLEKFYMNI